VGKILDEIEAPLPGGGKFSTKKTAYKKFHKRKAKKNQWIMWTISPR
jgi:hypothetical protein